MFRRAKISALLALTGTLTMSAAPLNPSQKNTAFQPGRPVQSSVLKPSQATGWSQGPLWSGSGSVQKITPLLQAPPRVEVSRHSPAKAGKAAIQPGPVRRAGGGK